MSSTPSPFGSSSYGHSPLQPAVGLGAPSAAPPAKRGTPWLPQNVRPALITVGSLAVLMAIIQVINWVTSYRLDSWGIEPRTLSDLWSILTAPLVHASWGHLLANLIPLVILGFLIMLGGVRQFVAVTVVVWLVSGFGVWLIAPANTTTVGASGVVFGWLAYLIARGIFTRTWQHILLGVVLLALWGSLFWTGIVQPAAADITGVVTVSWQAHLFGALGGVLAAFLVSRADRSRRAGRTPAINA